MNRNFTSSFILSILTLVTLSACGQAREELGLNRQSPDEFSVLKRAPLTLPPSYDLRPPRPGSISAASTTQNAQAQARRVLLGETANNTAFSNTSSNTSASAGTQILLDQAGANEAQSDIRGKLDRETAVLSTTDKTVAERLLFWSGDSANETGVTSAEKLNPALESQRLIEEGINAPTPGILRSPVNNTDDVIGTP